MQFHRSTRLFGCRSSSTSWGASWSLNILEVLENFSEKQNVPKDLHGINSLQDWGASVWECLMRNEEILLEAWLGPLHLFPLIYS